MTDTLKCIALGVSIGVFILISKSSFGEMITSSILICLALFATQKGTFK